MKQVFSKITVSILLILGLLICSVSDSDAKQYEAIVLGKMINKKVKKFGDYYVTEYKLKPKRWIYKNPEVETKKHLTVRILGAELPKKGIVIKASTAPAYVPMKREAIFFLEKTKKKRKNIYTISNNGILFKEI